ncbi:class I SAM-dependent methyltransferase [Canibacter zhoujuaniae]|uniref:class I SAM-dependent methyltransferase n=1 Tax=Canibacter zhoujuaniae TaxID=2708343 RepID=UPI00141F4435|nr:class I SAM-dependent methyltransferase [Canibacter zhoujuaniae]
MNFRADQLLTSWSRLTTPLGHTALQAADSLVAGGATPADLQRELRKSFSDPELVAATLAQQALRTKAVAKFGQAAAQMLFTPTGLEQATRFPVAQHHATRFKAHGITKVLDLGAGIGAESLAFAQAGLQVTAVEIDELTATFAAHNLREYPNAKVLCQNALAVDLTEFNTADSAIFIDPARRTLGNRNSQRVSPSDYSPSLDFVFAVTAAHNTAVKLGPGFDRELIPEHTEAEWVSINSQALETLLWSGTLRTPNITRRATTFKDNQWQTIAAAADAPDAAVRNLGSYIFEPDPTIIRARQIGAISAELSAGMLSPDIAYLTGETQPPTPHPFVASFKVLDVTSLKPKAVRQALLERGATSAELKKRGVSADLQEFRKALKLPPAKKKDPRLELTVFLTRIQDKHAAIIAARV